MEAVTCGAVAWKVRHEPSFEGWIGHFDELLGRAVAEGCDLVVFPEFIDLERLAPGVPVDLLAEDFHRFEAHVVKRAAEQSVVIVAGSALCRVDKLMVNRSVTAWPDGLVAYADKMVMTQFEIGDWGLKPGHLFDSDRGLGTTICYDSEFPASGRALAESGAWIQAVPAFTETAHGFNRVRYSCHARATENQVFVVHASLVGSLGYEPVPMTYGSAAIIGPSCEPLPASGVLAETPRNEEGVAVCRLSRQDLVTARTSGDVRNWNDRDKGRWVVSRPTFRRPS